MIKKIEIPFYLKNGIKSNDISIQEDINLISGDIETKPVFRLGLYRKVEFKNRFKVSKKEEAIIKDITVIKNRFSIFLNELDKLSSSKKLNVLFFHNLRFDLQVLMLHHKKYFLNNEFTIYFDRISFNEINEDEYNQRSLNRDNNIIKIKVFCSKLWFVKIWFGSSREKSRYKKMLQILDSFAFFRTSLYRLTRELKLDHKKYEVDFNTVNIREIEKYLENDLKCQYDLSEFIINLHKKYSIRICVSIAQMSMRIFKHKFLQKGDLIPQIPSFFLKYAIRSYHGGKNGFYSDKKKVIKVNDLKEYDVNSMYPYAMSKMPNFLNCEYELTNEFQNNREGIYCITGNIKNCKYPIFYTHDFKPIYGKINNLWVTSYELREALRNKEFTLKDCFGLIIKEQKEINRNPLKEFVNHFYKLKSNTPKNNPLYIFYKVNLNSLYGKFIQTTNFRKDSQYEYNPKTKSFTETHTIGKAGGLFQPLIATLITGFSRAYMHKLEHDSSSLHTATDSVMTAKTMDTNQELGGLSIKFTGDVIIFRNKTYILFGDETTLVKHGFHSDLSEILKLYINKSEDYQYERFCNIRESMIRKEKKIIPCEWNKLDSKLKVNW